MCLGSCCSAVELTGDLCWLLSYRIAKKGNKVKYSTKLNNNIVICFVPQKIVTRVNQRRGAKVMLEKHGLTASKSVLGLD